MSSLYISEQKIDGLGRNMNKRKRIALSAAAFFGVILFGTIAFYFTEPTAHGPLDSFFLTFTTVTTVGYGNTYPTTTASKLVASVVMIVGIGAALTYRSFKVRSIRC